MNSKAPEDAQFRDAGDFETWLQNLVQSFTSGHGTHVPCGECRACCSSGYFIPIHAEETRTIAAIPDTALFHKPGLPDGDVLLIGLTKTGKCSMLKNKQCSIYTLRPQACRDYDCRLFAAANLNSGITEIDRAVKRWRFHYRNSSAKATHLAIKTAASFVITHSNDFPEGKFPTRPDEIAIISIKAHNIFKNPTHSEKPREELISEYIYACRYFDEYGRIYKNSTNIV